MHEQLVSRRNALKYLSLLTGTEAGRAFLSEWLADNRGGLAASEAHWHRERDPSHPVEGSDPSASYTPQFFKPREYQTVEILADMIVPTDDKPGAREAQVARYIDFIVFSAAELKPELQQQWIDGLRMLDQMSHSRYGQPFAELPAAEREVLLTEISLPERKPEATHPDYGFYRLVKEMTVEGFYTSRVGLMEALEYKGLTFLSSFPGCTHPEHR